MPTLAAMHARRHVHDLARQHDVEVHWVETWEQAEGFHAIRAVRLPFIESGSDYLIALHELGHVIAPGAGELEERGAEPFARLAAEGLAWAWAAAFCDTSLLEPEDWDTPLFALWTHFEKELEKRGAALPHDPLGEPMTPSGPHSTSLPPPDPP